MSPPASIPAVRRKPSLLGIPSPPPPGTDSCGSKCGQCLEHVEGIPHTVIIGPDGKVAYVKTGYEPEGAKKIAETVKKLLGN